DGEPWSMTYIGDGKFAVIIDRNYVVITTEGEILVNRYSEAFMSFVRIIYYSGHVYGFGYGNSLYEVDKDTGEVIGEGFELAKKSRYLIWREESELIVGEIDYPFIIGDKLFAFANCDRNHYLIE